MTWGTDSSKGQTFLLHTHRPDTQGGAQVAARPRGGVELMGSEPVLREQGSSLRGGGRAASPRGCGGQRNEPTRWDGVGACAMVT